MQAISVRGIRSAAILGRISPAFHSASGWAASLGWLAVYRKLPIGLVPRVQRIGGLTDTAYMIVKVQHLESLQHAIEFAAEGQKIVGQNLANVNTPGYQTRGMDFQQLLQRLDQPESASDDPFQPTLVEGLQNRADGNNVDLDRELAALRKTALAYQTLTQLLGSKMSVLKRAIEG